MKKFIRERTRGETVIYSRFFEYPDQPGAGFSFDSDQNGKVDFASLNPVALSSYEACLAGIVDGKPIVDRGVQERVQRWTSEAILRCVCGRQVHLSHSENDCYCGEIFNIFGQRLAPRSQWGEETGESF